MFATTINLFNTYRGIFTLQKGPQDLPASYALLVTALCAYTLARFAVEQFENALFPAFLAALTDTAITSGIILAVLWARGVVHRTPQMLTAYLGIGAGFGLAITAALAIISIGTLIGVPIQFFVTVVTIPFLLVNVVINGHLFRATVSVSLAMGVIITVVLMFVVINVTNRFDPDLARTGQPAANVTPAPQMSREQ